MRALKLFVVSIVVLSFAVPAFAGNCFWNTTPSAIAFGTYSVFNASDTATTTNFSFRCTPNQYARLLLSTGSSGVFLPNRTMLNGAVVAKYNVFLDAGGSQIWGDTTGGVTYDVYNSTPSNKDFIDNMYGIMPNSQDLPAGTYTDTLFATLQYSNNPTGPWNSLAAVSVTVSATVLAECRVDSFNIDFGNYNPFTVAAVNQSTLFKVYCTKNSAPTSVTLNSGSFPLGAQKRMMSGAGAFLNYTAALGSTAGSSTSSLVPINAGFALNGVLAAQQDVATGLYQDTLVASVNY
jgi:spore coat protein U-like protein